MKVCEGNKTKYSIQREFTEVERDNRSRFRWTNNRQGVEHIVISYTKGYNISTKNNHKGIRYDIRRGHHKNTCITKKTDIEKTRITRIPITLVKVDGQTIRLRLMDWSVKKPTESWRFSKHGYS